MWRGLAIAIALLVIGTSAGAVDASKCASATAYEGPPPVNGFDAASFPRERPATTTFTPVPAAIARRLDQRFGELLPLTRASAAAVAIWSPEFGLYSSTVGARGPMWWASAGKLLTTAIILQLVDEKKLSLDATVEPWLADYPGADLITVEQLLTHTAGVFSFNADKRFRKSSGYRAPDELIRIAARHGFDFCPGTGWNYSNTGFVMLAMIASQIDGRPYADVVTRRIIQPLGLARVRVARSDSDAPLPAVEASRTEADVATVHGAGAILGDAPGMIRFLHAFLTGALVSPAARDRAFAKRYPMFGQTMTYGQGVMVLPVPDPDAPSTWIGHAGGAPGAKAILVYDVRRRLFVAVAINRQAPAEALANGLLKIVDELRAP